MRSVVDIGFRESPVDGFDVSWPRIVGFHCPVGDIVVVADPVHQDTTAERTMSAPPAMMPGSDVRQFRSGPTPLVVIEMVGWSDDIRIALRFVIARRQADFDALDFSAWIHI